MEPAATSRATGEASSTALKAASSSTAVTDQGQPTIDIVGVRKVYEPSPRWLKLLLKSAIKEPVTALHDISFQVAAGQICAVVGPNGAGKSTLFRVLTGLTTSTAGSASIGGYDCATESVNVRRLIGFMPPEDRTLFLRHDCVENLRFHGRMQGMEGGLLSRRIDESLELVGLAHARDRAGFALSSGMRSRLQLACAVMHKPRALILDEPTGAVDPIAAKEFLEVVQRLAYEDEMAVLISSHRLEEIEALDDNLILIDQGRLVYWGALDAMRAIWERPQHELCFVDDAAAEAATALLVASGAEVIHTSGPQVNVVSTGVFADLIEPLGTMTSRLVTVNEAKMSLRDLLGNIIDSGRRDIANTSDAA